MNSPFPTPIIFTCFCCFSITKFYPIICNPMYCSMPGFPVVHYLPEFAQLMSTEMVIPSPSKHLVLCCPLLLLPSIFPSIKVLSNESTLCLKWPKYQSFIFSIIPSDNYSGLIYFRIDWFDLFAVQGAVALWCWISSLALSFLYGPTLASVHDCKKNHSFDYMDLCQQSDVLIFNTLSRFVIAFLPRSKCLLIS